MGGLFGDPWAPGNRVEPHLLRTPEASSDPQQWAGTAPAPTGEPHTLMISIIDLPLANPAEPLLRWRIRRNLTFNGSGPGSADATVGTASPPSTLRLRKNGASAGTIAFTGTTGVISWTNPSFTIGDLFELYPPLSIDAALDDVSITFETD
jgi:hypothetical protein